MARRPIVLLALGLTALVVVAGVTVVLRGAGPTATGYAARIGCGVVLLQDRPVDQVVAELPSNPLVPLLRVERDGDVLEASLLGSFTSRAARAGDGGCRLLADGEAVPEPVVGAMDPVADDLVVPSSPATAAAEAGLDVDRLDAAVTGAFAAGTGGDVGGEGATVETRAVVVVHQGRVVAERYGEGFDRDTPLIGWSMTKSVAEAMTARLAQLGRLSSDDTIAGVWPTDDPRSALTYDDLLTMTSGLEWTEEYAVGSDVTTMLFTDVDAGAYAADMPLGATPGSQWYYSSGNSNILCDALVDVAGGPPALVARELVFEPLAMTSATLGTDGDAPVCSSFAYATARDWARFGLFYEQDGVWGGDRLLPEGWIERTTTAVSAPAREDDGSVTPYGRHWWLNTGPDGTRLPSVPEDAFWASGNEGQQVVVIPSRDLVVVRLGRDEGVSGVDWGLEPLLAGVVTALDGDEG